MGTTDIGYLLNKATRQLRLGLAARLAETGLRPQQAAALMAIGRSDERQLTPSQVADAIDVDAPTASGLLERLARDGWIESSPNPEDGRSRLVRLTPKATDVLPAVLTSAAATTAHATACLTAGEVETLERLLVRVCECGAVGTGQERER